MSNPATDDAFDVAVAALTAQRDRIDQTIALIRQLQASGFTTAASALTAAEMLATPISEIKDPADRLGPGAFLGLTIVDAAKKLLMHERRQLTNAELVDAFKRGGLVLNSADPLNTVGSVLNRRFMQVGDLVRVARGTWGLKEWYPNRSFKPATKVPDPIVGSAAAEMMAGQGPFEPEAEAILEAPEDDEFQF